MTSGDTQQNEHAVLNTDRFGKYTNTTSVFWQRMQDGNGSIKIHFVYIFKTLRRTYMNRTTLFNFFPARLKSCGGYNFRIDMFYSLSHMACDRFLVFAFPGYAPPAKRINTDAVPMLVALDDILRTLSSEAPTPGHQQWRARRARKAGTRGKRTRQPRASSVIDLG